MRDTSAPSGRRLSPGVGWDAVTKGWMLEDCAWVIWFDMDSPPWRRGTVLTYYCLWTICTETNFDSKWMLGVPFWNTCSSGMASTTCALLWSSLVMAEKLPALCSDRALSRLRSYLRSVLIGPGHGWEVSCALLWSIQVMAEKLPALCSGRAWSWLRSSPWELKEHTASIWGHWCWRGFPRPAHARSSSPACPGPHPDSTKKFKWLY